MKASINTVILSGYIALASAAVAPVTPTDRIQAVCGDLGVMKIDVKGLPDGAALTDIRMCAGHPLGNSRALDPLEGASLVPFDTDTQDSALPDTTSANPLQERACYHAAPYGCSSGCCWKACGDEKKGEWCWTASLGAGRMVVGKDARGPGHVDVAAI
ncbi:hypothetical protein QQX98_005666 [Neonectria punicea]|uniref:Uncharacterized protein n=1 Tax=Neonectria punicea TaxID=979145 RepID=A0ABR1H3S3_9HYPO